MLRDNSLLIEENIARACQKCGRNRESLQTIVVSKSVESPTLIPLIDKGYHAFAENRVEQLLAKQAELSEFPDLSWHLIGTLQTRKVKHIINKIDYFHALDNFKLACEIEKRATRSIKCFVQVNVSGETSKHGVSLEETLPFISSLAEFSKIEVVGLMTMTPLGASHQVIQSCFARLAEERDTIKQLALPHAPCTELSMGMSQDYCLAIEQGATFVRIGRAFFKD